MCIRDRYIIEGCLAIETRLKGDILITAIVTSNSILILGLTILFIREWNRRKALEELLRQSINYWKGAYEGSLGDRNADSNRDVDTRVRQ